MQRTDSLRTPPRWVPPIRARPRPPALRGPRTPRPVRPYVEVSAWSFGGPPHRCRTPLPGSMPATPMLLPVTARLQDVIAFARSSPMCTARPHPSLVDQLRPGCAWGGQIAIAPPAGCDERHERPSRVQFEVQHGGAGDVGELVPQVI